MAKERKGFGRKSRLDLLPEEAQEHLIWLNQELRAGNRHQTELRDIFNARLAGLGIEPISNGSFSRYSVRKAMAFREMDETLRISRELVEVLGVDGTDQMTITLSNMLQVAAVKMVEAKGSELASTDLMELAKTGQAAVSALKNSADYRRSLEREFALKLAEATKDVEEIGKVNGVSEETMRKITQRLAGIG